MKRREWVINNEAVYPSINGPNIIGDGDVRVVEIKPDEIIISRTDFRNAWVNLMHRHTVWPGFDFLEKELFGEEKK